MLKRTAAFLPPLILAALVATIAAGVQRYASPPGGLQLPVASTSEGAARIRMGGAKYPREAIDSDEFQVKVAKPARRIVSQYWAIDEYVYSVAPAEDVVAVSASAYMKSVSNVLDRVEKFHPVIASDPERVLALEPDLMVVSSSGRADYTSLARSSGVPVYRMQTTFATLTQVEESIRLTGYITGNDLAAEQEVARFWQTIEGAKALRPAGSDRPRILGLAGRYSYGTETLFDDIATTLGTVNVSSANGLKGYNAVDFEQIIRWDPEWIFAGADPGRTKEVLVNLLADPAISLTRAARNGHIVVLENHVFLPISPYTALLARAMAEAMYVKDGASEEGSHE